MASNIIPFADRRAVREEIGRQWEIAVDTYGEDHVELLALAERLPDNRDLIRAIKAWDGKGCLVVHPMAPQPAGRVVNKSGKRIHGIRIEMKT